MDFLNYSQKNWQFQLEKEPSTIPSDPAFALITWTLLAYVMLEGIELGTSQSLQSKKAPLNQLHMEIH